MRLSLLTLGLQASATLALPSTDRSKLSALWARAQSSVTDDVARATAQEWQYIIVGAGLGGLATAMRLAEDKKTTVLVIEAGRDIRNDEDVKSVAKYTDVIQRDEVNWRWKTEAQSNGRVLHINGGRGVGGSTSINGAAITRPPASQIDALGELSGSTDLTWNNLLPFYKKSEKFSAPSQRASNAGVKWTPAVHGTDGPVEMGFPDTMYTGPLQAAFQNAVVKELGTPKVDDLNAGVLPGVSWNPNTILPNSGSAQTRVSAATAYLSPIEYDTPNLVVLTNYRVAKLNWQQGAQTPTAAGVRIQKTQDGETIDLVAQKEVIVAAGAIRSPLLLQASGVGDKPLLEKLGVEQVIDLPGVGKHLTEQTLSAIGASSSAEKGGAGPSNMIAFPSVEQLTQNASGWRAYVNENMQGWAQEAVEDGAAASKEGLMKQYNVMVKGLFESNWPVWEAFSNAYFPADFGIVGWVLNPFSRGYVQATSTSPFSVPIVNPRYFSAPFDLKMQVAGLRAGRRTLQAMSSLLGAETVPGFNEANGGIPDGPRHGRYARWVDFVLQNYISVAHPTGTLMMMPRDDGGCVAPDFKLHGAANVRVVDASVLPINLAAHLSATLYALAEKAAASIIAARG